MKKKTLSVAKCVINILSPGKIYIGNTWSRITNNRTMDTYAGDLVRSKLSMLTLYIRRSYT